jgi:hypothetical protein
MRLKEMNFAVVVDEEHALKKKDLIAFLNVVTKNEEQKERLFALTRWDADDTNNEKLVLYVNNVLKPPHDYFLSSNRDVYRPGFDPKERYPYLNYVILSVDEMKKFNRKKVLEDL